MPSNGRTSFQDWATFESAPAGTCTCAECESARRAADRAAARAAARSARLEATTPAHCACGCGWRRYFAGHAPRPSDSQFVTELMADGWMGPADPITRRVWRNRGDQVSWYWEAPSHALTAYRNQANAAREGDSRAIRWLEQRGWKIPAPFPPEYAALSDSMRKMYRKSKHGSGHFGTEHEFFGCDEGTLIDKLRAVCGPEWSVKYDGSVNHEGMEVATPVLYGKKGRESLTSALKVIQVVGGTVDASCGLHVHHSVAHLSADDVWQCVLTYKHFQDAINFIMPRSRHNNEYCNRIDYAGGSYGYREPTKQSTMKELADVGWGRYYVVNLSAMRYHGTVEFRQHSATLSPEKTLNWVDLTRTMLNVSSRIEGGVVCPAKSLGSEYDGTSLNALMKYIGASESLREYYERRESQLARTNGDSEDQAAQVNTNEDYDFWCDSCGDGVYFGDGCEGCYHCHNCGCVCETDDGSWI